MPEKEVKSQASLDELMNQKKEIETLLKSLEDEYGRAQISEATYNEIKSKNTAKLASIDAEIQKLSSKDEWGEASPTVQVQLTTQPQPSPLTSQPQQPIIQPAVKYAATPDISKLKAEIIELKKKLDSEVGKLNIELEKMKALSDAQKDLRTATDEKIQRLTESVGELRSLVFQKEGEFDKFQMKFQKIEEAVNDIKPEQYSRELQKRDKDLAAKELRLEKLEKMGSDMVKDVNEIKSVFKEIGSVENLVNISKRINERTIKMENMVKDMEKLSEKIEKLYVDLNKKLEEFDEYKNRQNQTDGLAKDLMKSVDEINLRMGKLASTEEFMKLKTLFDSFTKDLEDVKRSVSSGIPFLGPLPDEVQQLQKQKQEISALISTLDEQYKQRAIKEEDYRRAKEANIQKLANIDKKIRESIEKIKGIPQTTQPISQPHQPPEQPKQETVENKSEKLISELKDLYKKGLISEKAYQKTSRLLVK